MVEGDKNTHGFIKLRLQNCLLSWKSVTKLQRCKIKSKCSLAVFM